jgi:hypothetical protein
MSFSLFLKVSPPQGNLRGNGAYFYREATDCNANSRLLANAARVDASKPQVMKRGQQRR